MRDFLIFCGIMFTIYYIVTALSAMLIFPLVGYSYEEAKAIGFILGNFNAIFNVFNFAG